MGHTNLKKLRCRGVFNTMALFITGETINKPRRALNTCTNELAIKLAISFKLNGVMNPIKNPSS